MSSVWVAACFRRPWDFEHIPLTCTLTHTRGPWCPEVGLGICICFMIVSSLSGVQRLDSKVTEHDVVFWCRLRESWSCKRSLGFAARRRSLVSMAKRLRICAPYDSSSEGPEERLVVVIVTELSGRESLWRLPRFGTVEHLRVLLSHPDEGLTSLDVRKAG